VSNVSSYYPVCCIICISSIGTSCLPCCWVVTLEIFDSRKRELMLCTTDVDNNFPPSSTVCSI
jgi:hypothetical protein